jgi:hypothetical protein
MRSLPFLTPVATAAFLLGSSLGCSGGGREADRYGIAATCKSDDDCASVVIDGKETQLACLTQFDAGYCAIQGCESKADCADGAVCVAHDDGTNYCFRECKNKTECNANRPVDSEANCSSSFDYASKDDEATDLKACIPPSSGD